MRAKYSALDFLIQTPQTSITVLTFPESFYSQWRVRSGVAPLLRDEFDSPPENLLQAIWLHQRVKRDQLKTVDGREVRVLHPGFHNLEGGPDFRAAVVQIGDEAPRSGDIEVDLRSSGWRSHGHNSNPAFQNVILHVVWESERPAAGTPPMLLLRERLDAPLGELSLWLGSEAAQSWPENLRGRCCAPLRELSETALQELLRQAAQVRLQSKAAQLKARARQAGWEQSLWEGLARALGYKHNVWPMQRLAELRSRWATQSNGNGVLALQARLLGISGLLPLELTRSQNGTDNYLRRVWDLWWRERDAFSDCILPRELWRLHGLRPANHPQRRLALVSKWAIQSRFIPALETWCAKKIPVTRLATSLQQTLQVEPDEFWSWHWTFRSARFTKAQPLIGLTRLTDLAVNVILPWLWIRGVEGKNPDIVAEIEQQYYSWPAAEDNSLLRLARQRLLGGLRKSFFKTASAQQGLIQIVRDFCEHSNAVCDQCKFPDLVREWNSVANKGLPCPSSLLEIQNSRVTRSSLNK